MHISTPVLFLCLMAGIMAPLCVSAESQERFAIYYSDQVSPETFKPYQLLVLDRINHPSLQPLSEDGKRLLGYLSLGEIEKTSSYFDLLKQNGLILDENKNWKGSYDIDLRNPLWPKIVIENLIPMVLREGFDGVFFDTLDSPLELEETNPVRFKGMKDAAVHLIEAVRMHYPQIKIMVNRAYAILPRVAPFIDMELGESIYADYNFDKKTYTRVENSLYRQQVSWLQDARQRNTQLKIYTLDYAEPNDSQSIKEIYRIQRTNGFIPYVATIGLDKLIKEPLVEQASP